MKTGTLINSETVANPWQFESGYQDGSTGLLKFGTRYYNPALGRWTQQDPVAGSLADAQGMNRYIFVGDDPANNVDPSGRDATTCILGLAGSIVGALASIAGVAGSAVGVALSTGAALVGAIFGLVGSLLGLAAAAIALVAVIVFTCGVSPEQAIETIGQLILLL